MKTASNIETSNNQWSAPVLQCISITESTNQELDGALFDGLGLS